MEHEGLPMIHVIEAAAAGDMTEVVRPDERTMSSSLGESSDNEHESATNLLEEQIGAMDPSETSWSYVFGPSMVTVNHIHRMSSLHYFNKGDALAFREEVVPEPANDEEVVFKEFFTTRLRMPSRPTLADILHKFWLQLHQLTPNAIAQLSKYF
jgi:hypothetical protein